MNTRKKMAAEGADRPVPGRTAQARLAAAHNEPIGPADIALPPTITVSQDAADLYDQVGHEDAKNPGVDEHIGPARPEQPAADAVRNAARLTLDRLGERWEMVKAAYEIGHLGKVAVRPVQRFREIIGRTWGYWLVLLVVLVAGVTAELVYGYRAAALLTLAAGHAPLVGAIAFSLAMNGLAWYAAHLLFASNQNIVRTGGAKIALVAALLISVLVAILGLVVGGFDPIQMNTVEGGGATTAATTGPRARWTLTIAYTLILVIVSAAIAAGHLLILDKTTDLEVTLQLDAERTAEKASLSPAEQTALIASLGEAIIDAIPAAHRVGRQYVATYNGSFRRHADVELGEMFRDVDYDDRDPEWLPGLGEYLDGLPSKGVGGRSASITRIA